MEEYLLPCLNKQLFGMECYGCGGQRSFMLLIQGNFKDAFYMFPAIYSLLILLIFLIINILYRFKDDFKIKMLLIYVNIGIIFLNYAVKLFHFFTVQTIH